MPERQFGKGPDNLWLQKDGPYLVIECKNGSVSQGGISKDDLGQLDQSLSWFEERYGQGEPKIPVMIHPLNFCFSGGDTYARTSCNRSKGA